jgi:nicotinic acid phosphoribosyltransferase
MVLDLLEIRMKTVSIVEYMKSLEEPFKEEFLSRKQAYQPNQEAINKLGAFAGEYMIIAFSAAWCKDCAVNIPVLAIINETSGLEVRFSED